MADVKQPAADVKPTVVVIVGPTGSGKTDLAITLAKVFDGEVIAADSRTVYRGMDIGTAKPRCDSVSAPPAARTARGRGEDWPYVVQGIPHHGIDIRNPDETYTVAEFQRDAERWIAEIVARGKLPIVVGGTGLYVSALVERFAIPEIGGSAKLREAFERKSNEELLALLASFDPDSATRIDPKNTRRLIRALEVFVLTGERFSEARGRGEPAYEFLEIGIEIPREELDRRIRQRTAAWLREGLLDEVRRLVFRYGPHIEPLRGLIYRQAVLALIEHPDLGYRDGDPSLTDLEGHINHAFHAYVRRQIRWFHRDSKVHWVVDAAAAEAFVRDSMHA